MSLISKWCGEGQWEEIVDRGDESNFLVYHYRSSPTPLTEEMW